MVAGVGVLNFTGASAGTTTTVSRVNCLVAGILRQNRDMNLTVTLPDSVAPGATFDMVTRNVVTIPAGEPAPPAGTMVKMIKSYMPTNANVASVNSVTFSGGNFSGTWARDAAANQTVITLTSNDPAGVPLEQVQTPQFTSNITLKATASGEVVFPAPPKLDLTVTSPIIAGDLAAACTAADTTIVMGRVPVVAPTTTTTATTRATTTTSRATTTTSRATTTTSRATTTTSRATTTTSRPATTTTRATSSTTGLDFFAALWKYIMCLLFGRC